MFGFLKKKLGEAISKLTDRAKEEPKAEEKIQEKKAEISQKPLAEEIRKSPAAVKPTISPVEEKRIPQEIKAETPPLIEETRKPEGKISTLPAEEKKKEAEAAAEPGEEPKKKGLFQRITSAMTGAVTTTKISEGRFEEMFSELEMTLLENNAAMEVVDKIKSDLKGTLVDKALHRGKIEETIRDTLKKSIEQLFTNSVDLKVTIREGVAERKPFKIMFVGINGSGKTTTIAKLAKMLQDQKLKVVIAASDTFRAAAIHQLQEHADKLGIKLIKHDYGSDPAAVAFDAIKYAEAHSIDVVLIDTAGRLHSNTNLIDEMKKIARVTKPDFKVFVGESITGNDCVEQARSFNEAIGIDGIILSKADVDEKGGAAISVSYITQKPILYLGTGQGYDDLTPFRSELIIESLGLS